MDLVRSAGCTGNAQSYLKLQKIIEKIMVMENSTAVRYSALHDNSPVRDALEARNNILQMTQQAEDAVLKPIDSGRWSHSLRAALAARIATQNDLAELAGHYASMVSDETCRSITDVNDGGDSQGLGYVVSFMDRVAVRPRDVVNTDISTLQANGVSDADIVKLTELNAFMAYQVRLVAGLKMISQVPV